VPSDLDRKFDAVLAAVIGPGGRVQIGQDEEGRAIVTNFPATLPQFFDIFCLLHGETIGVIASGERLKFADLNAEATRAAKALVGGWGIRRATGWRSPCATARLDRQLHGRRQRRRHRDPDQRLVADGRACARAAPDRAETRSCAMLACEADRGGGPCARRS
jgi:hypothetical protein